MTPTIDLALPERALAIGAHPDDIEFGCGATLAKWAAAGCEVHLLVLADGSKGTWDGEDDTATLVSVREEEQRAAAAVLGAKEVHFLRLVDGELASGLAERARVCEVIRVVRPTVVLGHDPWRRYRLHPDHRHAGWLTIDAVVAARDPHFFPEQPVAPHRPATLLLFEAEEVDHLERLSLPGSDATPPGVGPLDAKIAALLAHRSQWRSTMAIDERPQQQIAEFGSRERAKATAFGEPAGLGAAEGFKRLDSL